MNRRQMHFAGKFYPADRISVEAMIHRFNHTLEATPEIVWRLDMLVTYAIIVPHGGWEYSGFTANMAYRVLAGSPVDTVIVIGPAHHTQFKGISVSEYGSYETPLEDILIDQTLVNVIKEKFEVVYNPLAHAEHSTEMQMPFIRHYLPNAKIVELVYAFTTPNYIKPIIKYLLGDRRYAVVITTDLSHFHTLEDANEIDSYCIDAIINGGHENLTLRCEACGSVGIEALLMAAEEENLKGILLDYCTSADTTGDTSRVNGYMSALFQENL